MAETQKDNPDTSKAGRATEVKTKSAPGASSEPKGGYWWGTGRRKSSVARVRIRPGQGKLLINKKELNVYFTREQDRKAVVAPLKAVEAEKAFDVFVNVRGGGTSGQSGAVLLGIARALKKYDENYIQALRDGGHLTRDSRMVERKKYGQRGARRRFQFSKR
ncbi:MAG: 30S ribosomal protein S9 [Planctomycetota bacterium]|jgi:small subunit ribosomal protein S9